MAYQTRSRDPLLDSNMQAAVEKRGKELIGILLVCLGVAAAMMVGSYTADDPNWMASTDAPVQNRLGRPGAFTAAILLMIVGWAGWGLVLVCLVWGGRFILHLPADRVIGRLIFAPIVIALASAYCATLTPAEAWRATHSFGLGGMFGDMVLGAFLSLLPVEVSLAVRLMSLITAVSMLTSGAYVLGFTGQDIRKAMRFALIGFIMTYGLIVSLLGRGAMRAVRAARDHGQARAERRKARGAVQAGLKAEPGEYVDDNPYGEDGEPAGHGGLLAHVPALIRRPGRMPETELAEHDGPEAVPGQVSGGARIADVIRASHAPAEPELARVAANKPIKGREHGPGPLLLDPRAEPYVLEQSPEAEITPEPLVRHEADPDLPPEPPLTTAPAIPVAEPREIVRNPVRKVSAPSRRAQGEAQPTLQFEEAEAEFELPPLNLLANPVDIPRHHLSDEALEQNARMLESVLGEYGVKGEIVSVRPGPVVTMYELEPAPGLKASRVIGLADDIARSMAALSARVSTVPGRSVIGIELPNEKREMVVLREILASHDFGDSSMNLPLALGKDIGGGSMVANLARMPHLLIAGTTGSGKSVAINTMILSLLYKLKPGDCRLIMIDPKMLELSVYDGIPHLLSPVVTDPKKAVVALKWVVGEMEERYRKMSRMGVRNIEGYNGRVREALVRGETFSRTVQTGFDDDTGEPVFETEEITPVKLPYIVVIVDEMADLMMVAGKEIEACIQRLAQMARASGIHLIMATQRPSVDVITGTIKANFPTRISFQVTSKVDSRTILGEMGAEQLLGMGDMLYMAGGARIARCHGPFVSDEEVEEIVNHLKQFGPPDYVGGVIEGPDEEKADNIDAVLGLSTGGNTNRENAMYDQAVAIVIKDRKCSTSYIQRKLAIGYNKAARLVEQMEDEGIVTPSNHVGKREILVPEPQ